MSGGLEMCGCEPSNGAYHQSQDSYRSSGTIGMRCLTLGPATTSVARIGVPHHEWFDACTRCGSRNVPGPHRPAKPLCVGEAGRVAHSSGS